MAKILYIEDEDDFRENVLTILQGEGYETAGESSADSGLEAIRSWRPDLILCDVNMPDSSGFELLKNIRSCGGATNQTPFIFLTAMGQKSDIMQGLDLHADDYLVKPIDFDILLATIKAKLQKQTNDGKHTTVRKESIPLHDDIRKLCNNIQGASKELSSGKPSDTDIAKSLHQDALNLGSLFEELFINEKLNDKVRAFFGLPFHFEPANLDQLVQSITDYGLEKYKIEDDSGRIYINILSDIPTAFIKDRFFCKALESLITELIIAATPGTSISFGSTKAVEQDQALVITGTPRELDAFANKQISAVKYAGDMLELHEQSLEITKRGNEIILTLSLPKG